jgi:transposase
MASDKTRCIIQYLLSIPGIGFLTAITLYTEIMDIKRFSNFDQLASFVGLTPLCRSSGEKNTDTGITTRRNGYLRHLLIEAAWIAACKDPAMLKSFTELTKRMKRSNAIIRISKKLLNRIRYVWINEKRYEHFVIN